MNTLQKVQLMTAVVFTSSRPRFHLERIWLDVGYSGGLALSCWMFVCCRECLVSRVASTLAWPPAVLQSAIRPEGGSREALDNPIWAQGRQRKWLGIPDGGHNQENSCKGLNFNTSVWNSRLLPFSLSLPLSLSAPLPVFFLHQPLPLSPSSNSKQKTQLSTQRWTAWLILGFFLFFIISIFWISILHQAYLLSFTLSFSWPNIFPLSPSPNVLAHSFPFKKNAASIWLWSSFTFLFLPS